MRRKCPKGYSMRRGVCQPDNSIGTRPTPKNKFTGMSAAAIGLALSDGHSSVVPGEDGGVRQPCLDVCLYVYDNEISCGMNWGNCGMIGNNCTCDQTTSSWSGFNYQAYMECVAALTEECGGDQEPDECIPNQWGLVGCAQYADGDWSDTWCHCHYSGPTYSECITQCMGSSSGPGGGRAGISGSGMAAPPGWRKGGRITKKPIRRKKIRRR